MNSELRIEESRALKSTTFEIDIAATASRHLDVLAGEYPHDISAQYAVVRQMLLAMESEAHPIIPTPERVA